MALEAGGGGIASLTTTNPTSGDNVSQGDDHIRLLKTELQYEFPNFASGVPMTCTQAELNQLDGATIKTLTKDHGTKSGNYTLQMDEADMHLVAFSAAATLTIASANTNDKAVIAIKNGNNAITLAGIDNDSPTLTTAASVQDIIGVTKSFGKITCVGTSLNQSTT